MESKHITSLLIKTLEECITDKTNSLASRSHENALRRLDYINKIAQHAIDTATGKLPKSVDKFICPSCNKQGEMAELIGKSQFSAYVICFFCGYEGPAKNAIPLK